MKTTKYFLGLFLSTALLFTGCYKDDIDDLKKQAEDHAERLASLEAWQQTVNANITALQGLVSALENRDFVTGVAPVTENGTTVGYTISFSKSSPITIRHGEKGDKGLTPVIGVKEDTDGNYYWTLDQGDGTTDWLLDAKGNKVPTTGKAPKVRINPSTNYWEISANGSDDGYVSTGIKATGATGATGAQGPKGDQGNSIGIDSDHPDYVVFTLTDDTEIKLPKYKTLGITFTDEVPEYIAAGRDTPFGYTSTGSEAPTTIKPINIPQGWTVTVTPAEDRESGTITITSPSDISSGNDKADIVLLLSNSNGQVWMHPGITVTAIDVNAEAAKITGFIAGTNNQDNLVFNPDVNGTLAAGATLTDIVVKAGASSSSATETDFGASGTDGKLSLNTQKTVDVIDLTHVSVAFTVTLSGVKSDPISIPIDLSAFFAGGTTVYKLRTDKAILGRGVNMEGFLPGFTGDKYLYPSCSLSPGVSINEVNNTGGRTNGGSATIRATLGGMVIVKVVSTPSGNRGDFKWEPLRLSCDNTYYCITDITVSFDVYGG